jgi:recombination protein RecA
VRRIETLKQGGEGIGNRTRIKVVKNKIAPPFKEAVFDIIFGKGISREGDILDLAAEINIVNKSGAWYAYNGEKIGQGRENTKAYFTEHPEMMEEVERKVREYYHVGGKLEVEKGQSEDFEETMATKMSGKDTENVLVESEI